MHTERIIHLTIPLPWQPSPLDGCNHLAKWTRTMLVKKNARADDNNTNLAVGNAVAPIIPIAETKPTSFAQEAAISMTSGASQISEPNATLTSIVSWLGLLVGIGTMGSFFVGLWTNVLEPYQAVLGGFSTLLLLFMIYKNFHRVPQGQQWTVQWFGRHNRVLTPGPHLLMPIFERIGSKHYVIDQGHDFPKQEVITKDNGIIYIDGYTLFQIFDVTKASYEVTNVVKEVINLIMTELRAQAAERDFKDVLAELVKIKNQVIISVQQSALAWGVQVKRVELKGIDPHPDLKSDMLKKIGSERLRDAKLMEAEADERAAQAEALRAEMLLKKLAGYAPDVRADYLALESTLSYRSVAATAKTVMVPVDGGSVAGTIKTTEAAQAVAAPATAAVIGHSNEAFATGLANGGVNGSADYINGSDGVDRVAAE